MRSKQVNRILANKKRRKIANTALKPFLFFSEPFKGFAEPELNYYGFTPFSLFSSQYLPNINVITLSDITSNIILPTVWNYLDAACSISVGISQLLDEENYRQRQTKFKGIINILSGIQLFFFSYNPTLAAAFGLSGPCALAGFSFALAMLVDFISASIDFYNAWKERTLKGWFEEHLKEYQFNSARIETLKSENQVLKTDSFSQHVIDENNAKIEELNGRQKILKSDMIVRYRVNADLVLSKETYGDILKGVGREHVTPKEKAHDDKIQKKINMDFAEYTMKLIIKGLSLIGMSLLAAGSFTLFSTFPPAIVAGLIVTTLVSISYIIQHGYAIKKKFAGSEKEITPPRDNFFVSKSFENEGFSGSYHSLCPES